MKKVQQKLLLIRDIIDSLSLSNEILSDKEKQLTFSSVQQQLWKQNKHTLQYVDDFLKLNSATDLIQHKIFPNAKELTESFAAYHAVRNHLKTFSISDSEVNLIVVGDGITPRTAATFAFRTKWNCYSIDPELRGEWNINKLVCISDKIENIKLNLNKVIIVAVHSHADLNEAIKVISAKELAVVAIPCCQPQVINNHPYDIHYVDYGILSPQKNIYIWKSINQKDKKI